MTTASISASIFRSKSGVEVKGDEMTVDLSGVSPQVAGPYNSGATAGRSASEVAFKFLTTPLLLPINEGSFLARSKLFCRRAES